MYKSKYVCLNAGGYRSITHPGRGQVGCEFNDFRPDCLQQYACLKLRGSPKTLPSHMMHSPRVRGEVNIEQNGLQLRKHNNTKAKREKE